MALQRSGYQSDPISDADAAATQLKTGYRKIIGFLEKASKEPSEFSHVWIDTCCIDKSSSAELSEAINSMYQWYARSTKCYAYLADVSGVMDDEGFRSSRWFSRGWTLQELLAPTDLVFVDCNWNDFAIRYSIAPVIAEITGIQEKHLKGTARRQPCLAERMSWAALRETTRPEDMAYCLLGIFDVNMPLLYGEGGQKAFVRLQEEILKQTEDQSLLAWGYHMHTADFDMGVLASSPSQFARSRFLRAVGTSAQPFQMTNKGLHITRDILPNKTGIVYAALDCDVETPIRNRLVIPLLPYRSKQLDNPLAADEYVRVPGGMPVLFPKDFPHHSKWRNAKSIFISKKREPEDAYYVRLALRIEGIDRLDVNTVLTEIYPPYGISADDTMRAVSSGWDNQGIDRSARREFLEEHLILLRFEHLSKPPYRGHTVKQDIVAIRFTGKVTETIDSVPFTTTWRVQHEASTARVFDASFIDFHSSSIASFLGHNSSFEASTEWPERLGDSGKRPSIRVKTSRTDSHGIITITQD